MKENVGKLDRMVRSVLGPSLIMVGYTSLGGGRGRSLGLLSMMAGVAITESAITRVCPLSALFGVDSRSAKEVIRDVDEILGPVFRDLEIHRQRVEAGRGKTWGRFKRREKSAPRGHDSRTFQFADR
jgi:hypothetical protein